MPLPLEVQIEITQDSVPHICVVLFALLKINNKNSVRDFLKHPANA